MTVSPEYACFNPTGNLVAYQARITNPDKSKREIVIISRKRLPAVDRLFNPQAYVNTDNQFTDEERTILRLEKLTGILNAIIGVSLVALLFIVGTGNGFASELSIGWVIIILAGVTLLLKRFYIVPYGVRKVGLLNVRLLETVPMEERVPLIIEEGIVSEYKNDDVYFLDSDHYSIPSSQEEDFSPGGLRLMISQLAQMALTQESFRTCRIQENIILDAIRVLKAQKELESIKDLGMNDRETLLSYEIMEYTESFRSGMKERQFLWYDMSVDK